MNPSYFKILDVCYFNHLSKLRDRFFTNDMIHSRQLRIHMADLNLFGLRCSCCMFFFFFQMTAQFHLPSPLVRPREVYFARHSRQIDFNTWLVADVSLESVYPNPLVQFKRRPSGCLIHGLQSGLSMVKMNKYFLIMKIISS